MVRSQPYASYGRKLDIMSKDFSNNIWKDGEEILPKKQTKICLNSNKMTKEKYYLGPKGQCLRRSYHQMQCKSPLFLLVTAYSDELDKR